MSKSIEKACVRYNNKLYTGFDHGECFKKLTEDNIAIICTEIEQGFIDSDGNFVNRKQAMIIAKEAGQLRFEPNKETLISEDLYWDWLNKQDQQIIKLEQQLITQRNEIYETVIKAITKHWEDIMSKSGWWLNCGKCKDMEKFFKSVIIDNKIPLTRQETEINFINQ